MDPAPAPAPRPPGRALPEAGALTFLFTDVEGSTPLWERHEALMRVVAARHDALLDGIVGAHGGTRVRERGEGDSLFAVFLVPDAAVAAALAMARALLAEPWPAETPMRVRMGLHTGAAQLRAGDYYGPVVNRCARIRGLGHGGQVLLSGATAALARGALPEGASLRSLGAHTLKGLAGPEEVYQLCHPDLPGAFPPLLSPQAPRHNLPATISTLIGREAEQGEVLALLAEARLVTLVGSGGIGKTRLALALAAELLDQYPDGVWLVELASLVEPGLVPGAVAQALGVREEPGRALQATLVDHLKEKRALLVLDNCEHLIAACAGLASALLRGCAHLRILATSREGLDVAGEHCWRVPSLTVPDPKHPPPVELAGGYEAVRLFVARARERQAGFALTIQNARAVVSICARLDGIPLAIELASARVASLGVEGIAARLDDRFRLLTGGTRDALPRQRTLRAALDWSYDLLGEPGQRLLDRLSVFAGGWTLGAAEAVCAGDGIEGWEVPDLLGGLVHKSLLQAEEAGGELRYGLLETVRAYAGERLRASGSPAVYERHLAWCIRLADQAELGVRGAEEADWLARLETEHDNLRAALGWAREAGAGEEGLWLAGALWRFWYVRGHLTEGLGWLQGALAAAAGSPATRARALNGAGNLAQSLGSLEQTTALHAEALALRRALGDTQGIATSLNNLGIVAVARGDYRGAEALYAESLALQRELSNTYFMACILDNRGVAAFYQGAYDRAAPLHEEALALRRALGDRRGVAATLHNLGSVVMALGDLDRAAALQEEALGYQRELGNKEGMASTLSGLGWVAHLRGEHGRAAALHRQSLLLGREHGSRDVLSELLEGLAAATAALGQSLLAAQLGGASHAMRESFGGYTSHKDYQSEMRHLRAALGEEAFAAAWAEGRALPPEEAIALALAPEAASGEGWHGVAASGSAARVPTYEG